MNDGDIGTDKLKALQESPNSHIFVLAILGLNFWNALVSVKDLTQGAPPRYTPK